MKNLDRNTSSAIFLAIGMFTVSGTLPLRALWIELPSLSVKASEGQLLYIYLLVITECTNLVALAYLLWQRCRPSRRQKQCPNPILLFCFALAVGSLLISGFLWRQTTTVFGRTHNTGLLTSAAMAGLLSSLSAFTYLPLIGRIKVNYINAVIFGEGLSSLIPHTLAAAQGIGRQPECLLPDTEADGNVTSTLQYRPRPTTPPRAYFGRTTVTHRFEIQELRFSEDIYFFSNAGVIGLSIVCFIVLHCSSVLTATTESDREEALRDKSPLVTVLDDGTIKQKFIPSTSGSAATTEASNNNNGNRTLEKVPSETSGRQLVSGNLPKGRTTVKSAPGNTACWKFGNWNKPKLFNLLLGITLWSSFLLNGPLSSVYTYTCYSTGNHVFLVGAIFCDIFVLMSCVMSSRCTTRMDLSIVISFTCLGTIILTYFVALVVFTRGTHTRDYPIFGNIGEILTMISWVAVVGLFSFARVHIGIECQLASPEALMAYACAVRFGDAIGSVTVLGRLNICRLFRSFDNPCMN